MNRAVLLALVVVLGAGAAPAGQGQDASRADAQKRRRQIQMMEGVLSNAVHAGAQELAGRMQRGNPNIVLFTGQARARGFVLEGYGVFFDVEIPALRESVIWSIQTIEKDLTLASAVESLRKAFMSLPQGPERVQAEQALQRVQQLGPPPRLVPPQGMPGTVSSATVADPDVVNTMPDDPHTAYTETVKQALIDAMLEYSLPMNIPAEEWLTVAARDSEGPLRPGEIYEASTIVLRVKGSDLARYAADRSIRDEVRKRVEVRVF